MSAVTPWAEAMRRSAIPGAPASPPPALRHAQTGSAAALARSLADTVLAQAAPRRDGTQGLSLTAQAGGHPPGFGSLDSVGMGARTPGWNRNWHLSGGDAMADLGGLLDQQRIQSRDLIAHHPLAASANNTKVVRAVGTGLAYSAQPRADVLGWSQDQAAEFRAHVQAEFSLWADSTDCDWWGVSNFYDLQDLVLRSMLASGDCFTLLPDAAAATPWQPYRLRLQVIEADRVGNPMGLADTADTAAGIRRTAGGQWAAHVYDTHPGAWRTVGTAGALRKGRWVDAMGPTGRRRILHHFKALRPEQTRGVPDLAPCIQLFRDLGVFTDAEIKAAVVAAFMAITVESEAGDGAPILPGAEDAGRAQVTLGPAAVIGLLPGEKANAVAPGRPNPSFAGFVAAVADQLGAGLHIGSEMLMHRYSTSYVAARAAFLDAWKHLLDLRTRVIRSLCQPVVETWMSEAVAIGRVRAPGFFTDPLLRWAYTRSQWTGDSQGSINPKDEVAAMVAAIDARLTTRERAEWELFGTDASETYATKLAEHRRLQADGMLPAPKAGAAAPQDTGSPARPPESDADARSHAA